VRGYFFVGVVVGRRSGGAAPIMVLILKVVVEEKHASFRHRKHGACANFKDAASAGTASRTVRREAQEKQADDDSGRGRRAASGGSGKRLLLHIVLELRPAVGYPEGATAAEMGGFCVCL